MKGRESVKYYFKHLSIVSIVKCMAILNLRGVPFQAAVAFVLGPDFLLAQFTVYSLFAII